VRACGKKSQAFFFLKIEKNTNERESNFPHRVVFKARARVSLMTTTTTTTTTTPTKAIVVAANANDSNGSSSERNGKNKRAMRLTSTTNTTERITHARSSTSFARNHHHHHHHREESARDIVRRKRETFLAQMAVDIRKEEIEKLEKRAAQREEALRNAERMLEEDKKRFDSFLKENDERVREATRRAAKEAKKKREKANEVKRLNDEIATARLDLGRREDKLEECEEYLRFLDGLTPKEWLAEFREVEDDGDIGLEGEDGDDGDEEYGRDEYRKDEIEQNKPVPMYFTHPKQLLDVFAKLEEENLTLISEAQDIEDQLERDTERRAKELNQLEMESKRNQMEITRLREAIVEEMQKKKAYGLEASPTSTSSSPSTSTSLSPEQELEDLTEKVREVYESVVVSNDAKPPSIEAVDMLRQIEETLERYFVEIEKMPQDVVAERERKIEKERRHRNRELKMQQQKEEQELRLKKAMERAATPARKKPNGKPVMFRSRLREEKKEKQQNNTQIPKEREAEIELRAFLNREF